jgi:hypothetical protein
MMKKSAITLTILSSLASIGFGVWTLYLSLIGNLFFIPICVYYFLEGIFLVIPCFTKDEYKGMKIISIFQVAGVILMMCYLLFMILWSNDGKMIFTIPQSFVCTEENVTVDGGTKVKIYNIENEDIALANGLQGYIVSPVDAACFTGTTNKDIFRMDFLPDCLKTPFYDLRVNYPYMISDFESRNRIKSNRYTKGELFEFSYAITTHLSQGSEYPAGIYFEEFLRPDIQNSLIYTGITRFKQYMIYVKPSKKWW